MTADFAQLYSQLGLRADCSLEEFKHACRRRIADLHPDRPGAGAVADGPQIPLDELLALYAKAMRFHHKHGRLPGAVPTPVVQPAPPWTMQAVEPVAEVPATDASNPSLRNPLIVVLGSVIVLAVLASWGDGTPKSQRPASARAAATAVVPDAEPLVEQLELGMDPATVLAIQGEPMRLDKFQWEYGPSWLRFESDRLVDWHSSPLHPLKTATASPPPEAIDPH